jgi:hypothetical protein
MKNVMKVATITAERSTAIIEIIDCGFRCGGGTGISSSRQALISFPILIFYRNKWGFRSRFAA